MISDAIPDAKASSTYDKLECDSQKSEVNGVIVFRSCIISLPNFRNEKSPSSLSSDVECCLVVR